MSNAAETTSDIEYTPDSDDRTAQPSEIVHEDDRSRVVKYTIRPGEQTGWHTHELDYVVIYLTPDELTAHDNVTRRVFDAVARSAGDIDQLVLS